MTRKAANAPPSEAEKSPSAQAGRDQRGRFLAGTSGNPKGSTPITPEMKAVRDLCAAQRPDNIARLVKIRDTSSDEYAVLEAIKMMLQYSDGKPVSAHTGAPLVNISMANVSRLSPADAYGVMREHPELPPEQQAELVRLIREGGRPPIDVQPEEPE